MYQYLTALTLLYELEHERGKGATEVFCCTMLAFAL